MPKQMKAHVTIRRKILNNDSRMGISSSPPSLVPCSPSINCLSMKYERVRNFARHMATKGHNEVSVIHGSRKPDSSGPDVIRHPSADDDSIFDWSSEREVPQDAYLKSIFDWMCDMSSSTSESNCRRSKRLNQC